MANVIAPNGSTVAMLCPGCGRGWAIAVQESEEKGGITDTDVLCCQYDDCGRHYLAPDFGLAATTEEPGPIDETTPGFDPEEPQEEYAYDPTADQWAQVRLVRNAQLTQSDWVASAPVDIPDEIVDQAKQYEQEWLAFRQALRDVPAQEVDSPTELVWPTPPPIPIVTMTPPPDFVQLNEPWTEPPVGRTRRSEG